MTTQPTLPYTITSGLRDNHHRGTVGGFLADHIHTGSRLSVVSAYFTIYAFQALQNELNGIHSPRLLLKDLRNQIALVTGDKDDAFAASLNVSSIKNTLTVALRAFLDWAKAKVGERKTSARQSAQ